MGSNMAECHPVAFRWPMQAKLNGAKLVHVDPRFTRTSADADLNRDFKETEDLDGIFSGEVKFTGPAFWPYDGLEGGYDNARWAYERGPKPSGSAIGAVTPGELARGAPGEVTKYLIAKR